MTDLRGRRSAASVTSVIRRGVIVFPDRLAMIFLAAVIAVAPAVAIRHLTPWIVVPVFVVAVVGLWRLVPRAPADGRGPFWASAIALAFGAAWTMLNAPLASQLLWVTRDPGIYTVLGTWLMGHPSPLIDVSTAANLARGIPGLSADLGDFGASDGTVSLQGGSLVPALLGVGGWVFGLKGVLVTNVALGGVAIVVVYGLARRVVGPWFGLIAPVAMGLSVSFVYLSRAPYTEIVMTAVCAASLTWVIAGLRERRSALFAVAGAFAGLAGFARIDGALAVIGIGFSLGLGTLLIKDRERARGLLRGTLLFALFGAITTAAAALSLKLDEPGYYSSLSGQAHQLWAATAAALVLAVAIAIARVRIGWVLSDRALSWLGWGGAALVGAGFAVLLSRPLWYAAHRITGVNYLNYVAALQRQDGLKVDGTRSYDELSLAWFGWYFGWPTVALIGIGLCAIVYVAVRRRNPGLLSVAVATVAAGALYLVDLQVTPDQPWAFRRVLPLITPGFLIMAAYPLWLLWKRGRAARTVAAVLGLIVSFAPLVTWNGLMRTPDEAGEYAFSEQLCSKLDTARPVLLAADHAPANFAIDIRTVCGVQVVSGRSLTAATLSELSRRAPDIQVVVFDRRDLPGSPDYGAPMGQAVIARWQTSLVHLPDKLVGYGQTFWIGRVSPQGSVSFSN